MRRIINGICMLLGLICVGLGIVGIALPILPTTPLFLAAACLFAKGSERFHRWFLGTKLYKRYIEQAFINRSMDRKSKRKMRVTLAGRLSSVGLMESYEAVICVVAIMSSFGPTAALSALSNNLHHTLAAGNRVLDILEETPVVEEITEGAEQCGGDIICDNLSFAYPEQETEVLHNFRNIFSEKRIHGIMGKSGCGKSTLLKLLMRFYEAEEGNILYGENPIAKINTTALRSNISYVTQETFLFSDTIENNIKVARADATREEMIEAAKKASVHAFIMSTPQGYDTKLAELGDSVSGGERQRIGIARAFLHDSKMIFLDEPTSNIDSLNEGIILKSLEREKKDKTILLVSHRKSTMGIADEVTAM